MPPTNIHQYSILENGNFDACFIDHVIIIVEGRWFKL
jgi:hypothetical protein